MTTGEADARCDNFLLGLGANGPVDNGGATR